MKTALSQTQAKNQSLTAKTAANQEFGYLDQTLLFYLFLNAILKVYLSFNNLYFYPDTPDYLQYARNLPFADREISSFRAPLIPTIFSILFQLGLGIGAVSIVGPIFNIFACTVTFVLVSRLYGKEIGVVSSVLLSMNWHFWSFSASILTDVPGSAMIIITLYTFYRGVEESSEVHLWLSGLFYALSILTKWTNVLILPICIFYLIATHRLRSLSFKGICGTGIFFLAPMIVWILFNLVRFGDAFGPIVYGYQIGIGYRLGGRVHAIVHRFPILYYVYYTPYVLSVPCFILAVIGFIAALRMQDRRRGWILHSWTILFLSALSLLIPFKDERYIVYWTPALMTFSSIGIRRLVRVNKKLFVPLFAANLISTVNARLIPFFSLRSLAFSASEFFLAHRRILTVTRCLCPEVALVTDVLFLLNLVSILLLIVYWDRKQAAEKSYLYSTELKVGE